MFSDQVVIYVGTELREAYLLRDLLANEGIAAVVVSQGMSNRLGLAASRAQADVRVLVSQADAPRARQLAVRFQGRRTIEFQAKMSQDVNDQRDDLPAENPDGSGASLSGWPRCPECHRPRTTRCPFCGTAGSDFPPADPPEELAASGQACGGATATLCSSARCGLSHPPVSDASEGVTSGSTCGQPDANTAQAAEGEQLSPEYICPTCDEPFRPLYHRRCQWCDYEFPDGEDYPLPVAGSSDLNIAAMAAIVALMAIALGISAYLLFLF